MALVKFSISGDRSGPFEQVSYVSGKTLSRLLGCRVELYGGCCGQSQCFVCLNGEIEIAYVGHTEDFPEELVPFLPRELVPLEQILDSCPPEEDAPGKRRKRHLRGLSPARPK